MKMKSVFIRHKNYNVRATNNKSNIVGNLTLIKFSEQENLLSAKFVIKISTKANMN